MNFKKYIKITSLVLVICITMLAGVYAAHSVIMRDEVSVHSGTEQVKGKRINMLLLATDKGGLLTDTIMFASFDKERNMLNIMSIPRDTRVRLGVSYAKAEMEAYRKNVKSINIPGFRKGKCLCAGWSEIQGMAGD